jgi:zinc transport system ATP-binding protein
MNTSPLITLHDVSFSYNGEPTLEHITLDVLPGDYVGVIGPNGGGKTTLIKLMLGLLQPKNGTIKLWDADQSEFKQWHKIGYVPQRAGTSDFRLPITVKEVVGFGRVGDKPRVSRHTDRTAVQEAMERVGIADLATRRLNDLSGGQQQKVFIAKALAAEPEVLVLDEPTVGVDVRAQDEFYQLVAELNKHHGLTIIMVSHDIDVVVNEVSKLACINKELVYHGHPKEFMQQDYLTKLYGKTRKFILHGH